MTIAEQYDALYDALKARAERHYLTHWKIVMYIEDCAICDSEYSLLSAMQDWYLPLVEVEEAAAHRPDPERSDP